jgi:hypothetical protein
VRKYDPVRAQLSQCDACVDEKPMTFDEIDKLVRRLPATARSSQSWWTGPANPIVGSDTWPSGGWRIRTVDLTNECVVFRRKEVVLQVGPPGQPHDRVTVNSGAGIPESRPAVRASDPDSSQPQLGISNALSRREIVLDTTGAVVAAVGASIAGVVGITHLPWGALAGLSAAVAAIGFTLPQAIVSKDKQEQGSTWWRTTSILLVLLCAAIPIYHFEFDPATHQSTYQFVVNGDQNNVISLYGEPGGPVQTLQTGVAGQYGLIGGQTYDFDCYASTSDGAEWLRYERFGQTWWAPRAMVHLSTGTTQPPVPHC